MGLIKSVLQFIGGKPPQIVFRNGEVSHVHKEEKWQKWKDRFAKSPTYDWKQHVATQWDKAKSNKPKRSY